MGLEAGAVDVLAVRDPQVPSRAVAQDPEAVAAEGGRGPHAGVSLGVRGGDDTEAGWWRGGERGRVGAGLVGEVESIGEVVGAVVVGGDGVAAVAAGGDGVGEGVRLPGGSLAGAGCVERSTSGQRKQASNIMSVMTLRFVVRILL